MLPEPMYLSNKFDIEESLRDFGNRYDFESREPRYAKLCGFVVFEKKKFVCTKANQFILFVDESTKHCLAHLFIHRVQ